MIYRLELHDNEDGSIGSSIKMQGMHVLIGEDGSSIVYQ